MSVRRQLSRIFGVAVVIAVGLVVAGTHASAGGPGGGAGTPAPAPLVSIVIYDGDTLPATTLVACSEPDCLGFSLPPEEWTWEVTEPRNYIGWSVANWGTTKGRIYLYVDGKAVASARSGSLLVWSTTGLASGSQHTLQAVAYNKSGVPGWSNPVTVTVLH